MLKYGLKKHGRLVQIFNMRTFSCLLLIATTLASCGEDDMVKTSKVKYFDLVDFFHHEAKALAAADLKMEKQIIKDNIKEKKEFNKINWQEELKPFSDCAINKPAWVNSYQTDTMQIKDGVKVVYTAREAKLPVRTIELMLKGNMVTDITIHKVRQNFYYQSEDHYSYHVLKGYEINGSQNVRLLDKTNYQISAVYMY